MKTILRILALAIAGSSLGVSGVTAYELRWSNHQTDLPVAHSAVCTLLVSAGVGSTITPGWRLVWSGSLDPGTSVEPIADHSIERIATVCSTATSVSRADIVGHTQGVHSCRLTEGGGDSLRLLLRIPGGSQLRFRFLPSIDESWSGPGTDEVTVNRGTLVSLPPVIGDVVIALDGSSRILRVKGFNLQSVERARIVSWDDMRRSDVAFRMDGTELNVVLPAEGPTDRARLELVSQNGQTDAVALDLSAGPTPPITTPNQILIRFRSGEVEPAPGSVEGTIDAFTFSRQETKEELVVAGIHRLDRLLPWFRHQDVNATNLLGEPVTLEDLADLYVATLDVGRSSAEAKSVLDSRPAFQYVCENRGAVITMHIPNDNYFGVQWGLHNTGQVICTRTPTSDADINAPVAWDKTEGGPTVPVAVLDTGIDNTHVEFEGRVQIGPGQTFVSPAVPNAFDDDPEKHGTAVAGIIGATGDNVAGLAGVDWHVPLKAVKVLDETGFGLPAWVGQGIDWARINSVPILALALGFQEGQAGLQALNDICFNAFQQGHFLVAAMGNGNLAERIYPAAFAKRAYGVGAVWIDGQRWRDETIFPGGEAGSNFGAWIDVVAPGGRMIVTTREGPDGYYSLDDCDVFPNSPDAMAFGGTSAAVPVVAGVAALLRSVPITPGAVLLGEDLEQIMNITAKRTGPWNQNVGWGIVNAQQAIAFIDPASRVVRQGSIGYQGSQGPLTIIDSMDVVRTFKNVPGLPATYNCTDCKRYRLRGPGIFQSGFVPPPVVWTRSSGTEGWKDTLVFDYQEEVRWARVVDPPSSLAALFETFVFRVPGFGWFPKPPQEARIAFTAIGASNLVAVGDLESQEAFSLNVSPNPVSSGSTLSLVVPRQEAIVLEIVDVSGRRIAKLVDEVIQAGRYQYKWDGGSRDGRRAPAGVYFVRARVGGATQTMKLVLLGGAP